MVRHKKLRFIVDTSLIFIYKHKIIQVELLNLKNFNFKLIKNIYFYNIYTNI